jgi:hypothetical protein
MLERQQERDVNRGASESATSEQRSASRSKASDELFRSFEADAGLDRLKWRLVAMRLKNCSPCLNMLCLLLAYGSSQSQDRCSLC